VIIERITLLCKRQNKAPRSKLRGALLGKNHRFEVQGHKHRTLIRSYLRAPHAMAAYL
jgi:hypothetical protein